MTQQLVHWSAIRMFNRSLSTTVHESPEAMRRYLVEMQENGCTERDGYYLAAEVDGRLISVEGDGFDFDRIDWTGFENQQG